jgi:hypothetical protein
MKTASNPANNTSSLLLDNQSSDMNSPLTQPKLCVEIRQRKREIASKRLVATQQNLYQEIDLHCN